MTLRQMALLRCQELLAAGKKPLGSIDLPQIKQELADSTLGQSIGVGINEQNQKTLAKLFPALRAEADAENVRRANWMNARMETGRHPDTDAKFWQGWESKAPPSLDVKWFNQRENRYEGDRLSRDWPRQAIILSLAVGLVVGLFRYFGRSKRRFKTA